MLSQLPAHRDRHRQRRLDQIGAQVLVDGPADHPPRAAVPDRTQIHPALTCALPTQKILRNLEPLNEGRDERHRITYDSLWVHAKRHYDLAGIVAYRGYRMSKEFMEFKKTLRGNAV